MKNGHWGDWITSFLEYTSELPSPEIFRLWSGICAIAGAMERRVLVRTAGGEVYPNMFCLLVGPPASGKSQAIWHVRDLARATGKLHVAPNSLSKAGFLDTLLKSDRKIILNNGSELLEYHSLIASNTEFGTLVPAHDTEFLNVLNEIFDNPPIYDEVRRELSRSVQITNPQLNIIAGTQPGYLANLLPEEAWGMGFMSRIIMIYAGSSPQMDLFKENSMWTNKALRSELKTRLTHVTTLIGCCQWTASAKDFLSDWYKAGLDPVPEHSKLGYYNGRRILSVLKLCMVSAVSRSGELVIDLFDCHRARDWLLSAELVMPDVFREMIQKSDSQVIQELHFFLWRQWIVDKKPIHESRLIHFLATRVPSEKVNRVLEIAEKSHVIFKEPNTQYFKPKPKSDWGVE